MRIEENTGKTQKIFEQAIVVTSPDVTHAPPAVFSYFDPETKGYKTIFSDPVAVTIKKPASTAPDLAAPGKTSSPPETAAEQESSGLAPIKLRVEKSFDNIIPTFRKPGYISVIIALMAAIAGVTFWRLRIFYLKKRPEKVFAGKLQRQKRATLQFLEQQAVTDERDWLEKTRNEIKSLLSYYFDKDPYSLTTEDIKHTYGLNNPITELFTLADNLAYGAAQIPSARCENLRTKLIKTISEMA